MAESSRSVRRTKNGRKIVTRTNKAGKTVRKVMGAKGEDGKRKVKSTSRTKTLSSGATVTKKTGSGGNTTRKRTRADGSSVSKKTNTKGKVLGIKKTDTEGNKKSFGRKSGAVAAKNKIANATTESKGKAGRVKRLQEKKAARVADGKKTGGIQKRIQKAKKNLTSGINKRKNAKK